jgi:hypothetical protein
MLAAALYASSKNPYHGYIGLHRLQALWGTSTIDVISPASTGIVATEILVEAAEGDARTYSSRDERLFRLETSLIRQRRLRVRIGDGSPERLSNPRHDVIYRELQDLHESNNYGAEDSLFAGIHRIAESWVAASLRLLNVRKLQDAERYFLVSDIIEMLGQTFAVLDLMVMEEYHPLRVALKGSSGAQSEAMLRLSRTILTILKEEFDHWDDRHDGRTLVTTLATPWEDPAAVQLCQALASLDSAHRTLFFSHFERAITVQSVQGLGALGGGLSPLRKRMESPVPGKLDEARFRHAVMHNVANAEHQGKIVKQLEVDSPAAFGGSISRGWGQRGAQSLGLIRKILKSVFKERTEPIDALLDEQVVVQFHPHSRTYHGRKAAMNLCDELRQWCYLFNAHMELDEVPTPQGAYCLHVEFDTLNGRRRTEELAIHFLEEECGVISELFIEHAV